MILLADNDLLRKLAECDLLDDAVAELGAKHDEVFVLERIQYVFGLRDEYRGRKKLSEPAFRRLRAFFNMVRVLDQIPPTEEMQLLVAVEAVDNGEAILFASSALHPGCTVAMADKRSVEALASAPTAASIVARLVGRVVCFEQILLRLCDRLGFEEVRARIPQVKEFDTVVAIAFGSDGARPEEQVRQALHSYVEDLRRRTGSLLSP